MQPLMLDFGHGSPRETKRFCVVHPPIGRPLGLVVYAHPFAEEMNKSRRMASMQARALANAGYAVLMPDLFGCGDSAGDMGDATWEGWIDDVLNAVHWLRKRYASVAPSDQIQLELTLWGLRSGCLLAAAAAARLGEASRLIFWQPTLAGKSVLQQFLRIQMAGGLLGSNERVGTKSPRDQLAAGERVEVGGYWLSPDLARGLDEATLAPHSSVEQITWLEVSSRPDATLSPSAHACVTAWEHVGAGVDVQVVAGPAFWQTTEIEDAPALLVATLAAMARNAPKQASELAST